MNKLTNIFALALVSVALVGSPAAAGGHKNSNSLKNSNTIVDVAASAGQFNTLIAAAKAAGLAGALAGDGPLTVFAPTDEAFAALPAGTVENLLRPENKEQLVAILTYHVAPAKLKASDVVARSSIETLNGQSPEITVDGSEVHIDGANIVSVDIAASNGIIHVIDKVLLPPTKMSASSKTRKVIDLAIAKGAPMYNHGNAQACADIYEVAATSLLTMDDSLNRDQRRVLQRAIARANDTHSASRSAWIMRDALDAVYDGSMPMMLTAN